ncbi:MAG TPA: pilus assembly protein PilP [Burkholderiales bacterium]|jgi:type IV pilus assembly protein PilP|nr:pilus assembly protein PilP [Burkholderiales bacterium]
MRRLAITLGVALALAGCEGGEQQELRAELASMTKDLRGKVDPLPVVKAYEPVPYTAYDLADPFGPAKIQLVAAKGAGQGAGGLQPDLSRPKEPLEAFPLESLKMVGTLERGKQTYALVRADAGLYRVRVGNYLGQNFGVITKITDSEVGLRELVQDAGGDWTERESTLLLQEADLKEARK